MVLKTTLSSGEYIRESQLPGGEYTGEPGLPSNSPGGKCFVNKVLSISRWEKNMEKSWLLDG